MFAPMAVLDRRYISFIFTFECRIRADIDPNNYYVAYLQQIFNATFVGVNSA